MANTKTPQPCGTPAAWKRHRYRGEEPCDACIEAYRAARNAEYAQRSAEKVLADKARHRERYLEVIAPARAAGREGRPARVLKRDQPCIEECGRLVGSQGAKGRCSVCNQRLANAYRKAHPLTCEVPGCGQDVVHAGHKICAMHRSRVRNTGEAGESGRRIAKKGDGSVNKAGYRVIVVNGRQRGEHCLKMEELLGRPLLRHETVHHRNGQRADNATDGPLRDFRSGNLELWSTWQPKGQRVVDKVEFAVALLREYAPELLA